MTEKKRQRRKDARPDEIITAALEEFHKKGFGAASIGSIAARAGIARSTVYLYFQTKDAIFEAAITDRLGGTVARAQEFLGVDEPFEQIFERILRNYYDRVVGTDASILLRVLIAEGGRFPDLVAFFQKTMLAAIEDLLHRLISDGVAKGEVRKEILDHDLRVVIAPAVFAVIWGLIFGATAPLDKERFIKSHLEIVLRGIRAS